jgi:hypothetical protein
MRDASRIAIFRDLQLRSEMFGSHSELLHRYLRQEESSGMNVADQHPAQWKGSPPTSLIGRVYPEFANSLRTALESGMAAGSPAESGGLLFGTTEEGVVSLRAFRPFATWDQR